MSTRAAIATGLLALAATACSADGESAPAPVVQPPPASTSVTTAPPTSTIKCTDFDAQTYTGLPAARANDVKAQGWFVEFIHAGSPGTSTGAGTGVIERVAKQQFGCVATFTLKAEAEQSAFTLPGEGT